mgnify:CR=1 FL=1
MIVFDSRKDDMDCPIKEITSDCRIIKYNSIYRLEYRKLDLVISNFEIFDYYEGRYIKLYDLSGNSCGILEVKSGGWQY